jgi:hypothetical protein
MNQVLDGRLLEGNVVIGGLVHIKDGVIKDNPFSKSVGNCLAAHWLLENSETAKNKIRAVMREQHLGEHEVDECFDYAIYFFLEKEDRDFKSDHFGEEASNTYSIDIYCLYKLKMIVYEYRNEMKKRLKATVHLVDIDKDEQEKMPKKCISFDVLNKASFEHEKNNYGFNDVTEYQDLQELLDIELPFYNEDFRTLGMHNFDFRSYVYHLFLGDLDIKLDGSQLTDETLELVSIKMGVTKSTLKKQMKIVKELMKTRKDLFRDIPELMLRLVNGKQQGWKPVFS